MKKNLKNKKILLIISGGIAAYKCLDLIRLLKKEDVKIKTVLTSSAKNFVTPLSIAALSKGKVYQDFFDSQRESEFDHISLSRWADVILVAPATANIIAWENCRPVFVDIDPLTWNIDPEKIEEKITDKTTAILPVHIFGVPCNVEKIKTIASKNNLKVIYDAAHAFDVNIAGKSIIKFGDVSAISFHATKFFNTAEGGAIITNDDVLAEQLKCMRYFGFDKMNNIVGPGLNAKMSEICAGLGLANLKYLNQIKRNRKKKYEYYISILKNQPSITFQMFKTDEYNYSYMPVIFESEEILLKRVMN